MKSTVIKASEATANEISTDLLSRKSSKGKEVFHRIEITQGFEIKANYKGNEITVFRYTNDNGRKRFDYDERLLTF